jgi:hypothetical protein
MPLSNARFQAAVVDSVKRREHPHLTDAACCHLGDALTRGLGKDGRSRRLVECFRAGQVVFLAEQALLERAGRRPGDVGSGDEAGLPSPAARWIPPCLTIGAKKPVEKFSIKKFGRRMV